MHDDVALEGAKQIRPDAVSSVGSVAAHSAIGEEGRRRCCLRRDRYLGEGHPANVRSDADGRRILMQLCQRYVAMSWIWQVTDDHSENGWWAGQRREDRRNGQGIDQGH